MFGNNFFPQFFVFKNSFMFSRTKNLFGYSKKKKKKAENKKYFYITNYEGN